MKNADEPVVTMVPVNVEVVVVIAKIFVPKIVIVREMVMVLKLAKGGDYKMYSRFLWTVRRG